MNPLTKQLLGVLDDTISYGFRLAGVFAVIIFGCALWLHAPTWVFVLVGILVFIWACAAFKHATDPKNYFVQFDRSSPNDKKTANEVFIERWESQIEEQAHAKGIKLPPIPDDLL